MPIYKSTFIKFIKSASTWLPLLVILFIISIIGAILPLVFLDLRSPSIIQTYKLYIVASITTIGSSTSIVSAAFAAYKSVQIYKQEIEEGTFLVLVSKPLSRKRIIFEKWLALLTIIAIYSAILISFYIFLVLILDPGNKIANLDITPLRDQIFYVGLIVMIIVFILTLMFSSIALILSSKLASSATIALVAGLGAIIPITGILPTFTQKQPLNMITPPVNVLSINKIPRQETITFVNSFIQDENVNSDNIINLFDTVKINDEIIDNNKNYIKNLGISSGDSDLYSNLHFFDLNYQVSTIATIASDLLIPKKDRDFIAANAIAGGFVQSPTLGGKIDVSKKNIQIHELSKMLLETIKKYENVTRDEMYGKGIYPFFDYILRNKKIIAEQTTNDNFKNNLIKLIVSFGINSSGGYNLELQKFISSPIINTILDDPTIDEKDKRKLQSKENPFRGEIKAIEILLLLKINIAIGSAIDLIIYNNFVENFYNKNEIDKFVTISEAFEYLNSESVNNEDLNTIINDYSKSDSTNYNDQSIIRLANTLLLSEKSSGGISSFEIGTYSNKWVVFSIYIVITFGLLPISYLVIKKQDIR
ncbi:MAG: ABC transporter permease subunit [Mycoplasmataceae bacterium]|nr:ABC transporter permease subunit [Mycoplasmataceae bacterium]